MQPTQPLIWALLLVLSLGCASNSKRETADAIFFNGKIYTLNKAQEWAEAIAIKEDEIVFVSSNEDIKQYQGEATETTDLAGKIMLSGFVDAHSHPIAGGESARIPLDLAIFAQTLGAADAIGISNITGSLEVGKKADLVILEDNLFDVDQYKIREVKVMATLMNGK